jgi:hypothetical protein
MATGYGLDGQGIGFRFPPRVKNYSLLQNIEPGSGTNAAPSPMGTKGFFPRVVKREGSETDHSPPSRAKVKNDGVISPLPIRLYITVLNSLITRKN